MTDLLAVSATVVSAFMAEWKDRYANHSAADVESAVKAANRAAGRLVSALAALAGTSPAVIRSLVRLGQHHNHGMACAASPATNVVDPVLWAGRCAADHGPDGRHDIHGGGITLAEYFRDGFTWDTGRTRWSVREDGSVFVEFHEKETVTGTVSLSPHGAVRAVTGTLSPYQVERAAGIALSLATMPSGEVEDLILYEIARKAGKGVMEALAR